MGFLDSLTWQVLGGGSSQVALYNAIMDMIGGRPKGLPGILAQLTEAGLGEHVRSWVGTGPNIPVTQEQIRDALGGDAVRNLAQRAGMTEEAVASRLPALFPRIIDTLTPNGVVPSQGPAPNRFSFLAGMTL